jgi:hypothetical protein
MSYPIGTRCLIVGVDNYFRLVGKECITVSELCTEMKRLPTSVKKADGYWISVDTVAGDIFIDARYLIKIDPDQDFSGESEEDELDKTREKVTVGCN